MLSNSDICSQVQDGLAAAPSLAQETAHLEVRRDLSGATCINQYVVVRTLGHGSCGKVKLCLNAVNNQLYAVKMINRSLLLKQLQRPRSALRKGASRASADRAACPAMRRASNDHCNGHSLDLAGAAHAAADASSAVAPVMREIAVMKKMQHSNLVKLHELIDCPGSDHLMLVMEYMEGGPVMATPPQGDDAPPVTPLPLNTAAELFRQACRGVDYMHYHHIVHGDLKPDNLLMTASRVLKIADFGCSRVIDHSYQQQRVTGTPAFHAPEVVTGRCEDPFAADVWALGVCLYCFVCGRLPFRGGSMAQVYGQIVEEEVAFGGGVAVPADLRDLLGGMLEKDPMKRLGMRQVMEHRWTTGRGLVPIKSLHAHQAPPRPLEATPGEQGAAISPSAAGSFMRARVKEAVLEDGEYLFRQGQPAESMWFITRGAVELQVVPWGGEEGGQGGSSLSLDLDESFTLDLDSGGAGGLVGSWSAGGKVHLNPQEAQALRARSKHELASKMDSPNFTIGVRGPGQVVGAVSVNDAPRQYACSACAKGSVLALKLSERDFLRALARGVMEASEATEDDGPLSSSENVIRSSAGNVAW